MDLRTARADRRRLLGGALGIMALAMIPGLSGCGRDPAAPAGRGRALTVPAARRTVDATQVPELGEVVEGMRTFTTALHAASATTGNWTVSPVSIAYAFGMLRAGARGDLAHQLDAAFGWPAGPADGSPHQALNALTADLVTTEPVGADRRAPTEDQPARPVVAVANGLFLDDAYAPHVHRQFLTLLAEQYGAHPTAVSFADGSAIAVINAWVREQTRERIDRLFDELDPATRLVLANAVYLKAAWLHPFDPAATTDAEFARPGGPTRVPLMRQQLERAGYDESPDWQRVRLPYAGGELAMTIVLPREVQDGAGLGRLLAHATAPRIAGSAAVDLTLPRWDTATTLPLLPVLAELGVTDLAGLGGIADDPDLAVSDAIHRANVTVDEEGTEAAAVTGIAVGATAAMDPPRWVTMRVDRPFVWSVVHVPTGTPVFAGQVVNPA